MVRLVLWEGWAVGLSDGGRGRRKRERKQDRMKFCIGVMVWQINVATHPAHPAML